MQKIDQTETAQIQELYEEGLSASDISNQLGLSMATIKRYIKKLPEGSREVHSYNQANQRKRKALSKISNKNISQTDYLCQDDEEGWTIDINKLHEEKEETSKYWMGICYPESVDIDEVIRQIKYSGLSAAISPLHNKDKWLHDSPVVVDEDTGEIIYEVGKRYKAGDPKKAHYHIIFQFPHSVSFKKIAPKIMRILNTKIYPKKVWSPKGSYEYLWHKNEDLSIKASYDKEEVTIVNEFTPELTTSDKQLLIREIQMTIVSKGLSSIQEVFEEFHDVVEVHNIYNSHSFAIKALVNEQYYKKNPNKVKEISIKNIDPMSMAKAMVEADRLRNMKERFTDDGEEEQ